MQQHQLLMYFLGFFVIAIALFLGLHFFEIYMVSSNRDAIVTDLHAIVADAAQYALRPVTQGGGGGSYEGYSIPDRLASNDDGSFSIGSAATVVPGKGKARWKRAQTLSLVGESANHHGLVTMVIDDKAEVMSISFTGEF